MYDTSFTEMILPEGIMNYFDLSKFIKEENSYRIYLEENKSLLLEKEYSEYKLTSKGFYDEVTIQDFPIRGKATYLHVRRRRWLNETTGDIVCRDWKLVAKGTRMTQEFAFFLKEFIRYNSR